ncbi:hypothetical protein L596_030395 [Steinernema carpocapsae]|uniref:Uncharacterized protein n=1 Tax=Steinernema carpocapsae TaxID=34508 RepID=A0A4U5LPB4_STECR|nr:hypothetical protein L596_030395 [Steinernema carpocapsae]
MHGYCLKMRKPNPRTMSDKEQLKLKNYIVSINLHMARLQRNNMESLQRWKEWAAGAERRKAEDRERTKRLKELEELLKVGETNYK